ncbi:MAG: MFS transporter [Hyphomicrobiaceae bacterium]|nr:MFS transporter [Hyphomicrobiaceae bacterium]
MTGFGVRVAVFFAALFLIYGVHIPYLPLWLEWRGLTPAEIGIVTSAPYFARLLVTPTIGFVADRVGDHARVIRVLAFVALSATLVLSNVAGFAAILAFSLLLAVSTWTIMPLTETIAIRGVRLGLDYGRMRLWGSLSFILASFAGGAAVDAFGRGSGIWLIAGGCVATVTAAFFLPGPDTGTRAGPRRGIDKATVLRLAGNPVFLLFLLAIGTIQASHATFYTFGAIHWRASGMSSAWIGVLWAIGVLTEVALFAVSGRIAGRVGPIVLLGLGGIAAIVRWTAMSADPAHGWLIPLQVLHGLTYGASHLGAIHFIERAIPDEAGGTAQALYATIAAGVMHGAATMLSGLIYAVAGEGAYLAMSALSLIGVAAVVLLARLWTGGKIWIASPPAI